jgi:hypothetical protein
MTVLIRALNGMGQDGINFSFHGIFFFFSHKKNAGSVPLKYEFVVLYKNGEY